jgi:signal transduction histidine kinase
VGIVEAILDITERKRAEEKLLKYQEKLRSLTSQLSMVEEQERRHIATDIHDHIGQTLAISSIKLGALREAASATDLARPLEEIQGLIKQAIEYTRSLTFELSPPILHELDFEQAVDWLAEKTQEKHGLLVDFEDDGKPKPMDDELRIPLFKMVRELLVNVSKHAKAKRVKVSISRNGNNIHVNVEDNGVGLDTSKINFRSGRNCGFGLFNIHERLDLLGGYLKLGSTPGQGTLVSLVAPLKHEK